MLWITVILILPYLFLILRIYFNLQCIHTFSYNITPAVSVSVIIPCKNEQETLPALLECLAQQDYPNELIEIIVVDDHSADSTSAIVQNVKLPFRIRLLQNAGSGKKAALKSGIEAASGKLLISTDADCTMSPGWVKSIAACFELNNPDLIIAPVKLQKGSGLSGKFQELEFLGLQGITAGTASTGNGIMCNGANLAFTREAYKRGEPDLHFEHLSGDDIFLLHSLKKSKYSKILWLEAADAIVTAGSMKKMSSFFAQRNRWISKWKLYNDNYTIIIGAATFIAVILQITMMGAASLNTGAMAPFLTIFILKSIPDFMILRNRAMAYNSRDLMRWFIPSQIIYPFYVLAVLLSSPVKRGSY
jgi:poly-beta-1,6-N-acetyl-D-glucosamine synthase